MPDDMLEGQAKHIVLEGHPERPLPVGFGNRDSPNGLMRQDDIQRTSPKRRDFVSKEQ
jgi:hypothetical protein